MLWVFAHSIFRSGSAAAVAACASCVKLGIEGVEVSGIQFILYQAERLAEALEVHHLSGAQEADGVRYIRGVYAETQDIVVGSAGLFFCCNLIRTTFH